MGGFGSIWHWVIVLLVIILLFGAKKIPELAKGLGSGIKNFKKAVREEDDNEENIIQTQEIKKEQPKKVSAPRKPRTTSSTSTKKSTKTATKKTTTRKTKEA